MIEHKVTSIDRYIRRFESVSNVIEELKTVDTLRISKLLGITHDSAKEYTAIYLEYKGTGNITRLDYYSKIHKKTDETLKS